MARLGLFDIDGVTVGEKSGLPKARIARMTEKSKGKDTTIGHWEIAGVISKEPLPTYPKGFPEEVLAPFREKTGGNGRFDRIYFRRQCVPDSRSRVSGAGRGALPLL